MFNERLRELRRRRKMSQGELADAAGINRSYLSMIENGHSSPTMEVVERLAKALNVPIWQLTAAVEERHYTYDTDEVFEMYDGLKAFLADEDEMLLTQPTPEEIAVLRTFRFSSNFVPDKRFYRDALLAYRRTRKASGI